MALLLCTSSTLKLLLSCPPPPQGPLFLLCFLVLLFRPVAPISRAQVALPWCRGWLALTCFCRGSVPLLLLLPAGLFLPALACPSLGSRGLENVSAPRQSISSCPTRTQEVNQVGFLQQPHHHASGRLQVEAGACQCRKAPGMGAVAGGTAERVQLCGALWRVAPGGLFVLWLIWLQPAKFGRFPEVMTWKASVVINFLCHTCFETFLILIRGRIWTVFTICWLGGRNQKSAL